MQKHHSRLPIILILVTLLSATNWAVASASSRVNVALWSGSRTGVGHNSTFSGEPDTPGVIGGGGKATPGSSLRGGHGAARTFLTAGIWIRLFEVRLLGQ